jgi:hypothetical protein
MTARLECDNCYTEVVLQTGSPYDKTLHVHLFTAEKPKQYSCHDFCGFGCLSEWAADKEDEIPEDQQW